MIRALATLALLLLSPLCLNAQEAAVEDPAHEQLRELRQDMLEAIQSQDIEAVLSHVHPDIVTTWQDGKTTHGIEELRDFYKQIGKEAFVSYEVPHKPDQLSVIHGGDLAISAGHLIANYKLLGKEYQFTSRWTATLVREDDKWLVAAYHVSLNALDNPILDAAKSLLWVAGAVGVLLGLGVGFVIFRRKKAA
ncbi:MAG: nuclear transport factor 2 family protein [Akkermansiaceae bacterium]|nr:nuclear transport factor 2 family protein [Akkermansiaceae bacterium]